MGIIARLSHVGFNIPREKYEAECEFWEKVVGLERSHSRDGQSCFFRMDPLRDHEFILFAVDGPVTEYGEAGYMLSHVSFDVPTFAEIDQLNERLHGAGTTLVAEGQGGRRRSNFISPAGIRFELNTPPYTNPEGRE